MRTISLYDLATAVKMAIRGDLGSQQTIDLVEDKSRSLGAVVAAMRQWLGFAPARAQIVLALVDQALFALYGDTAPEIRAFFYGGRRGRAAPTRRNPPNE